MDSGGLFLTMANQKTADYWNKRGETYSRSWKSVAKKRLSKLETDLVRRAIASVSKKSQGKPIKTLDIGVGIGRISEVILEHEVEHYGTDISQTMVDYCREKFKDNQKVKEFLVHDILKPLPKEWGNFDVVTAVRVLSYTPLWEEELRNIYQAMNPGGVLVFTFPNKYSSALLPKLLLKKEVEGYETTYRELKETVKSVGFYDCQIVGFSRLLDTFYDWCNSAVFAKILFGVEKVLGLIFGPRLLVRLFYISCQK